MDIEYVCVCVSVCLLFTVKTEKNGRISQKWVNGKGKRKLWHEWFAIYTCTLSARCIYFKPTQHEQHARFIFSLCNGTHHHESFMECNVITNDFEMCNAPMHTHSVCMVFSCFHLTLSAFIHIIIYVMLTARKVVDMRVIWPMNACHENGMAWHGFYFHINALYTYTRWIEQHKFFEVKMRINYWWVKNEQVIMLVCLGKSRVIRACCIGILNENAEQYVVECEWHKRYAEYMHCIRYVFDVHQIFRYWWYLLRPDFTLRLQLCILLYTSIKLFARRCCKFFPNNIMFCCIYSVTNM